MARHLGVISPTTKTQPVANKIETMPVTSAPHRSKNISCKREATTIENEILTNSLPKSSVARIFLGLASKWVSFLFRLYGDFLKWISWAREREKKAVSEPEKKAEKPSSIAIRPRYH